MNIAMRSKIKSLREGKGISQRQMAEKLHMDERNYKRIESGEKKTMDLDLLGRIAEVLETDVPELLTTEVMNVHNGDNTENNAPIGYGSEINITNNFPPELKQAYEDIIQLIRDLIVEKDKTIARLEEIMKK